MKIIKTKNIILIVFYCLILPAILVSFEARGADISTVARDVCKDVGVVETTSVGPRNNYIIIFEEVHTSRAGQIEQAIILVRLHERYGLKDIALEGYLKDQPKIKTDWFQKASCNLDFISRASVAMQLLKEGEISGAEFMKLTYDDISLHPIEAAEEYSMTLDDSAVRAPIQYLIIIAQQSLREEHMPKLEQYQRDVEKLTGEPQMEKAEEMLRYILSVDPWTEEKGKALLDLKVAKDISTERELELMEEIVNRAKLLSLKIDPDIERGMERNLKFWRGRAAANKTMVSETTRIANTQNEKIIAMIIGAGHTKRVCEILGAAQQSFAVVTPLSLKNNDQRGDLTWEMFERKEKKMSVYSGGYSALLFDGFYRARRKPEPVLSEPFFQAKTELYTFIKRITSGVLGPPAPPGNGGPPFGFGGDDFKGEWVFIDPKKISIIPDTDDGKGRTVLFPAILNYKNPKERKEIWVKSGLAEINVPAQEREDVESLLKKALKDVQSEKRAPEKVESKSGRVQITADVVAVMAGSKKGVIKLATGAV